MNILHINNFHYLRGGSEAVYFKTADILERHGHKSIYFSMDHPKNLPCETENYFVSHIDLSSNGNGTKSRILIAGRILYSFEAKKRISYLLDKYPIDIAHMHNIYHELSPSVIDMLKKRKIPMVMTLHDYKMICASYSMLADGKPCEACSGGRYFNALRKRCIKESLAKSALAYVEIYLHNKILDIYSNVNMFISPSIFLREKLKEMGFKKEIIYLPNFVYTKQFEKILNEENISENSLVYFGRLSPEKGLSTLLQAAKKVKTEIKIIGDGPMKEALIAKAKTENILNVRFLGYMKGEPLFKEIRKSAAVVLPSEWYENNPMSVVEAFALGKPVIGSQIGGIPELVINGKTGFTFAPGDAGDLSEKIITLLSDNSLRMEMGENARKFARTELNPENYYQKLMKIYQRAIDDI